jgi:hypothetical protein
MTLKKRVAILTQQAERDAAKIDVLQAQIDKLTTLMAVHPAVVPFRRKPGRPPKVRHDDTPAAS